MELCHFDDANYYIRLSSKILVLAWKYEIAHVLDLVSRELCATME